MIRLRADPCVRHLQHAPFLEVVDDRSFVKCCHGVGPALVDRSPGKLNLLAPLGCAVGLGPRREREDAERGGYSEVGAEPGSLLGCRMEQVVR